MDRKKELLEKIGLTVPDLSEDAEIAIVQWVKDSLAPRNAEIIISYYGLGCEEKTLVQLGVGFGVSRERITQVRNKSIRQLKWRECILAINTTLEELHWSKKDPDIQALRKRVIYCEGEISRLTAEVLRLSFITQPKEYSEPVDSLDFTIRTSNCLKAENISTIGELLKKSNDDLLRIPNLGRKGVNEIMEVLASRGLCLR